MRGLVERAMEGDRDAFGLLINGVADRMYAVATRILRDVDLAEDAVQSALINAWRDLPRLRDPASDRGNPLRGFIWVSRVNGSGLRRMSTLPESAGWHSAPRFAPDGTRLVYTEFRGGTVLMNRREGALAGERSALFTIRLDGTDVRRVTPWGTRVGDADWSPDATRLTFETVFEHLGNTASVYVVNADGTHLRALTRDAGVTGIGNERAFRFSASFDPAWSPDGTKIIYSRDLFDDAGFTTGLQTMGPDGSGQAYVSAIRGSEHQVDWGTAPLE